MARSKSVYYLPPLLFSVTLCISAGLLFWIQPLTAKTLLPLLGGAPAVWNTCLLFFQTMLLLGYVYAVASSRWLSLRSQAVVHLSLLLLIAIYLFRSAAHAPVITASQQETPTLWLLQNLLVSVGPAFFIISASNPLLQSWFSRLRHYLSVDPYFLFAASNAGSLIALLAFPLVLEPSLGLNQQLRLWRIGFTVLVALMLVIALALKPLGADALRSIELPGSAIESDQKLTAVRRLHWLALSFVPSSLMIGVTTYVTADVAAVPLLWVIPLALYLLTFVLAFTHKQIASAATLIRVMFVAALIVILILSSGATEPAWLLILANLGFFFVAALTCHGQLANDRPTTTHLAEYYLWIAIGGALGSLFNVLIAPVLFTSVLEYPLVIAIACMLQRDRNEPDKTNYLDIVYPLGLYALYVSLTMLVPHLHSSSTTIKLLIVPGIPLIILNHFFRQRPIRFGLGLCAVVLASVYLTGDTSRTLHVARNFFGTIRVTADSLGKINSFYNGNTVHGRQFVDQSRQCG